MMDRAWFNEFARSLQPVGVTRVEAGLLWEDPDVRASFIARPTGRRVPRKAGSKYDPK